MREYVCVRAFACMHACMPSRCCGNRCNPSKSSVRLPGGCECLGLVKTIHTYVYVYMQCIHGICSREITIHTVIYGEHLRYIWQGSHQIYSHLRCRYMVFLAGKSPYIRSYTVNIYGICSREVTIHTAIHGEHIRYM